LANSGNFAGVAGVAIFNSLFELVYCLFLLGFIALEILRLVQAGFIRFMHLVEGFCFS